MVKHFDMNIFGEVQGVGFRWSAKTKAGELGIKGFVKNEPDGSLKLVLEGEENQLEKFIEWCRKGPAWAKIEKETVKEGNVVNYKLFEIL